MSSPVGEAVAAPMLSITFKPRTQATTFNRGFIGRAPTKELELQDLQNIQKDWSYRSEADVKAGKPPRRHRLISVEGRLHALVLERFVQIVMGEGAMAELTRELTAYGDDARESSYVLADFDQMPNSVTGDRRVVSFRHFPKLRRLRALMNCWVDHRDLSSLVADVVHWDPAQTMRGPEAYPMHSYVAGLRFGTPASGMSLPTLSLDTSFGQAEVELNPGDAYFLVSEVMEFLDEASERLGLRSLMDRQAEWDAKEPVNDGPSEEGASFRGQQAPSSDDEGEDNRERSRLTSSIRKGKKIVRNNAFLR